MRPSFHSLAGFSWRTRRSVPLIALLIVLAGLGDVACRTRDVLSSTAAARDNLSAAQAELVPLITLDLASWSGLDSYDRAAEHVRSARDELDRANERLGYLDSLAGALRWMPSIGDDIAHGPEAIRVARDATAALDGMLEIAAPLVQGESSTVERVREVFVVRHVELDAELARLDAARRRIDVLQEVSWDGPFARVGPLLAEVAEDLGRLPEFREFVADLSATLDGLLGFDGPRRYIVLGQNEQEIRPTGGFIGTMGLVTVENGAIVASDYRSSYEFDPPGTPARAAPLSMQYSLGVGPWHLRDSNWSPWFDETGARVINFFEEDQGIRADGVIAADSPFMRLMLAATGPMELEALDEPLMAETFYEQVEAALFGAEVGTPGTATKNLVPNGGFETGTAGWEILGLNAPERVEHVATDGGFSLHVNVSARETGPTFMFTSRIPVEADRSYTASWHVRQVSAAAGSARGAILWYGAEGDYLGAERDALTVFDPGPYETFRRFEVTGTAPIGARYARVSVNLDGIALGDPWEAYLDAVQLEVGAVATPYEDTDFASNDAIEKRRLLQPVLEGLIERVQQASGEALPQVLGALQHAARGRHLQLYATDPREQAVFERFGVAGTPNSEAGSDFVAVIDANVSYVKIQSVISQQLTYLVRADGSIDVVVMWQNGLSAFQGSRYERLGQLGQLWNPYSGSFVAAPGTFGNFVRIYLPEDVQVEAAGGFVTQASIAVERGMTIVSGMVVVPDGETRTVLVHYRTQDPVSAVRIWKQGGLDDVRIRVLRNTGEGQQLTLHDGVLDSDISVDVPLDVPAAP